MESKLAGIIFEFSKMPAYNSMRPVHNTLNNIGFFIHLHPLFDSTILKE